MRAAHLPKARGGGRNSLNLPLLPLYRNHPHAGRHPLLSLPQPTPHLHLQGKQQQERQQQEAGERGLRWTQRLLSTSLPLHT